ncbi:N-acyl amino acid synthase FeeM domain-containing protein [Methylobacterium trifolii]|uniref:N-acyl amino acid synthase FeeM domain-containing protein n=1 Tax=Methylobacterium trifolii TaxID=1003092 RepID=UPI001EDCA377|nr:hypothetical protein [Methylobacterium trifolii]
MRYHAYLKEGAILYHASEKIHDHHDELPNAKIVGVYVDGALAASIRVHVVSINNTNSPAVEAFGDLINPYLSEGSIIIDPNRFVSDHSLARRTPDLPYATLRIPFMAAKYYGAQIATATVRKEHQAFYRRVLHYTVASEPRHYPTLIKPLSLMIVKFKDEEARVLKRYPFLAEYYRHEMASIFSEVPASADTNLFSASPKSLKADLSSVC